MDTNGKKSKFFFKESCPLKYLIPIIYAKFDWYGGLHRLQFLGLLFQSLYFYNMFIIYSGFYNIFSEPWLYSKPSFLCLEKVYAIFRLGSGETIMSDREYTSCHLTRESEIYFYYFLWVFKLLRIYGSYCYSLPLSHNPRL